MSVPPMYLSMNASARLRMISVTWGCLSSSVCLHAVTQAAVWLRSYCISKACGLFGKEWKFVPVVHVPLQQLRVAAAVIRRSL